MDTKNSVAIIDIGSNAVRLVIYDGLNRAPVRIHSERIICNLGADLATTGRLNPDSVKKALNAVRRFSGLIASLGITAVHAVATAAMRDAGDGAEFIARVEKEFGLIIKIVDGEEEARLAALGVLSNGLGMDGVIGDYGGGSLELIAVEGGEVKHKASLPLGSHRLLAEPSKSGRIKKIEALFDSVAFLDSCKGKTFYAMGGAWRSMAKAHIHMSRYPLQLLDHYSIPGKKASEFAELMARQSAASLTKTVGMSKKRIKDMGVAALVMQKLFERIQPETLSFSGTGLREGLLFDQLSPALQKQDPLLASAEKLALSTGRYASTAAFKALFAWIKPLFPGADMRLIEAACLMSDTGWLEHEDYQANLSFQRIIAMPFYGISHAERSFLALTQYVRYRGYLRRGLRVKDIDEVTYPAQKILDNKAVDRAVVAGLALRVGYMLTGGALELLRHTSFEVSEKHLSLKMNDTALNADVIGDALEVLAQAMGRTVKL